MFFLFSTVFTASKGICSGRSSPAMTRPVLVSTSLSSMRHLIRACRPRTPALWAAMTSQGAVKIMPSPFSKLRAVVR